MEIALWVIGIHLIEIAGVAFYLIVRKNNALEKAVTEQQQYIDSLSIIISNSEDKLKELDERGVFEADDEIGFFFNNLKEIQKIISEFNSFKR